MYGALCWNLAHVIKTKDLPHIFCTYVDTGTNQQTVAQSGLPLADFKKAREEVTDEIDRAPERRSDNLVSTLYDTARRLQVHARVSSALASQYHWWKTQVSVAAIVIIALTACVAAYFFREHTLNQPDHYAPLLGGLVLAVLVIWIGGLVVNRLIASAITGIDDTFLREYEREFTMQDKADLEAVWQEARPLTLEYIAKTGIENVPRKTIFNKGLFEKVETAIAQEIPTLRREIKK